MNPRIARSTTLNRFANTFVPFALMMSASLIAPEAFPDIAHRHAMFTIWTTMAFMIPALCLFFVPGDSEAQSNYWLLCWTFGFLALVSHFYFTIAVIFHGSLQEVYAQQGPIIATSNFVDLGWWGFDLLLAWLVASGARWIHYQRVGAHLYIPLTFFISAVIIKHGFVRGLGIVMTVALLVSLVLHRYLVRDASPTLRSVPS